VTILWIMYNVHFVGVFISPTAAATVDFYLQGSHASWKVLEFFSPKFKALNVLEKRTGA